jgi:hypothetical protein
VSSAGTLAAATLFGGRIWAQEGSASSSLLPEAPDGESLTKAHPAGRAQGFFRYDADKIDLSLGVFAQLTGTRTTTTTIGPSYQQNTAGATPSAGFLAVFHQQFRGWAGYDVNAGYSRTVYNYTAAAATGTVSSFTHAAVGTNMYELSVAYVAKAPASTHHLQTFAQGGGGVLAFLPTEKLFPGAVNFRAAALFGAGADYRLSDHLGLRVEYRGLFFKTPDFVHYSSAYPTSKLFTVSSQPVVSLIYRFGSFKKMQ